MVDEYQTYDDSRSEYVDAIVLSPSKKKLVVAGPGTGKSTAFQHVAIKYKSEGHTDILVLSFINELVRDLAIAMHGLATISTLHSFATGRLRARQDIYMQLLDVLARDYELETGNKTEFRAILQNLELHEKDSISYMRARRAYYSSYDPDTTVFDLVEHYSDASKIPSYDLILVDEYQDFNKLEIELINLLSTKSDVLIAGDDDQSLYSFKHAMPEHVRELAESGEFDVFGLPYCSRCTEVVIDAFHDVVRGAQSAGLIERRLEKEFKYFPCMEKDEVSNQHKTIDVILGMYQTQNGYFIDSQIRKIFECDPRFSVLIVCPLKKQISSIAATLRKMGYKNVESDDSYTDVYTQISDGLRLLVEDKTSNLGWRLCADVLMSEEGALKEAVLKSAAMDKSFSECLPVAVRSKIRSLRAASVKLQGDKVLTDEQRELIFEHLGIVSNNLGVKVAKDMIFSNPPRIVNSGIKMKITTIPGSKGLSYDYVFLVNFDDRFLIPRNVMTDECVNKFLVALTRSRKKTFIFSQQTSDPVFVSWIDPKRKSTTLLKAR